MKWILYLLLALPLYSPGQDIITVAGDGSTVSSGDGGPATLAGIGDPFGIKTDAAGNVYFVVVEQVRMVNTAGTISTIAGNGTAGFSGDGGPATAAEFTSPYYLAVDHAGYVYVADALNYRIRKIAPGIGGVITTIAGTGVPGYNGDGILATAAEVNFPTGIAVDAVGDIFFADSYNYRIRKINAAGIITTIAGTGVPGFTGDGGPATAAEVSNYMGMDVDGEGNVYMADGLSRVRKIDLAGIISTVAGTATYGFSGDGGPATSAELDICDDVKLDNHNNMYIADVNNGRIRKVDTAGIITTIAGNGYMAGPGTGGFSGDFCAATNAALYNPRGVCADDSDYIYIADGNNHRIRKLIPDHAPAFTGGHRQTWHLCGNSVADSINLLATITDPDPNQTEIWTTTILPLHGTINIADTLTTTGGPLTPSGLTYTALPGYYGTDSFSIKVTDCGNLTDSTTIVVTIANCALSLNNQNEVQTADIKLSPNPCKANLGVSSSSPITQMTITNLLGQTLFTRKYNSEQVAVDVADLPAGVYLVKINGSEVRKFVKE